MGTRLGQAWPTTPRFTEPPSLQELSRPPLGSTRSIEALDFATRPVMPGPGETHDQAYRRAREAAANAATRNSAWSRPAGHNDVGEVIGM